MVIVSNDTDIAPALKLIRTHTAVRIGLVIPARHQERMPNTELTELSYWMRSHINPEELAKAQLPRVIGGRKPTIKPESWYASPDLLTQVLTLATSVLGSRGKAFKWMEEENPFLNGGKPIDLVETDQGTAKVLAYIEQYRQHHIHDAG